MAYVLYSSAEFCSYMQEACMLRGGCDEREVLIHGLCFIFQCWILFLYAGSVYVTWWLR